MKDCLRKAGDRKVLTVEGLEYAFRWCPPGEFLMGGNKYDAEKPPHQVRLTNGFWLLETPVTQAMWWRVMGRNPSWFKGKWHPVERVNWYNSQEFCRNLRQKLGQEVRLPSEAQWEYACRAGSMRNYAGDLDSMAWYIKNSHSRTRPVGQKKPNDWGLYDMLGNIFEWCLDYYDEKYYAGTPTSNPVNRTVSACRVTRGGSWGSSGEICRPAQRFKFSPEDQRDFLGLRVLLVPDREDRGDDCEAQRAPNI